MIGQNYEGIQYILILSSFKCALNLSFVTGFLGYGITTPVDTKKLKDNMRGCLDYDFMVDGFTTGFALGVRADYDLVRGKTRLHPAPLKLVEKLEEEVMKGRIIGPFDETPVADLHISPLHVIPKADSEKVRMIFNLSHPPKGSVNENIGEEMRSVSYCSVQDVGDCLQARYLPGQVWMAKVDLADAYRIVPIRVDDWKFLGICVNGKYYIDRMLPMGAASSCKIFQRISDSLREMFIRRKPVEVDVFNYLDDFLFVASSQTGCNQSLKEFEAMCQELGVPVASQKTVVASQVITFLGLGINGKDFTLFIPEEKRRKVQDKITQFLNESAPRVKKWQSIAGSLNHIAQVISSGRVYLGSVYSSMAGILSQDGNRRRRVSAETRLDLGVWFALLDSPPERAFLLFNPDVSLCPPLYTDASTGVGFGAVWGDQWFYGQWPAGKSHNIAVLELYPIVLAIHMLDQDVRDTALRVFTDNAALVSVLNRLYSRDALLRRLLRPLVSICLQRNLRICASHVAGSENVAPDLLSRGKIAEFKRRFPTLAATPMNIPETLSPVGSGWLVWD